MLHFIVYGLLLIVVIFYYPSLIFLSSFIFLLFSIQYKKRIIPLMILFAINLLFFWIKTTLITNYYDDQQIGLAINFKAYQWNILNFKSTQDFITYVQHHYYPVLILFLIGIVWLMYQKKYLHLFLVCFYILGYLFIIFNKSPNGYKQFYIESQYLLISVFVASMFIYSNRQIPRLQNIFSILIFSFVLLSLLRIIYLSQKYTARNNYIRQLVHNNPDKTILEDSEINSEILLMNWGLSYEVWLLTTLESGSTKSLYNKEAHEDLSDRNKCTTCWIHKFAFAEYKNLNKRYFKFIDSVNAYQYKTK